MRRLLVLLTLFGAALVGAAPGSSDPADVQLRAPMCAGPCWLSVGVWGTGEGVVTDVPDGSPDPLSCKPVCLASYPHGSTTTIVATPKAGSRFTRWEGLCNTVDGPRCTLFMDEGKTITAVFDRDGEPDSPPAPPSEAPPLPPPIGVPPPPGLGDCTIVGTSGRDELTGTPGRDVICALGGNDHVHPLAGNDVVRAGDGADEVEAGPGDDRVDGGRGGDELFGDGGRDRLIGGPGRDAVTGGAGGDTLVLRDGVRDVGRGGGGLDRARVDRRDSLAATERRF